MKNQLESTRGESESNVNKEHVESDEVDPIIVLENIVDNNQAESDEQCPINNSPCLAVWKNLVVIQVMKTLMRNNKLLVVPQDIIYGSTTIKYF